MPDMNRLRRLSRLMQTIVMGCTALVLLGVAWALATSFVQPTGFAHLVREGLSITGPIALTSSSVGVTVVLIAVQLGFLLAALYCVWRMFGAFAADEPLSGESARWMRRAGLAFVAVASGSIVLRALMVLVLTLGNPPGQKMLAVGFGSSELLSLLIAGIMYMTSHLMAVAADVRADQRGFV
ncbi:DUF2975 domain-containing protein [Nitratireductor pacificus]|uniref:DUF2975 domain-containing protein n=1 Tax=Nitratireductor pacificus pht-3B TaxID=391937 RepID=K2MEM0_9HYPH|nr:DUF2975 domain-containing protein [Nitratireductor pacificus]EKF19135.1 hypothetical protein NA2_10143 [Nitratireductor pacificus pht-3B]